MSVLSHARGAIVAHRKGWWTVLLGWWHLDRIDAVQYSLSYWKGGKEGKMSDSRYRAGLTAYKRKKTMANQRVG